MDSDPLPPLTPCVGVCRLDAAGFCLGCLRSRDEIARWSGLDDEQRLCIMRQLPLRGERR
jgi:predicted Fe-S protein YdhL (DUF1289 family)